VPYRRRVAHGLGMSDVTFWILSNVVTVFLDLKPRGLRSVSITLSLVKMYRSFTPVSQFHNHRPLSQAAAGQEACDYRDRHEAVEGNPVGERGQPARQRSERRQSCTQDEVPQCLRHMSLSSGPPLHPEHPGRRPASRTRIIQVWTLWAGCRIQQGPPVVAQQDRACRQRSPPIARGRPARAGTIADLALVFVRNDLLGLFRLVM